MFRLSVVPAHGEPFEHTLEGDEVVVGRASQCELSLADRFLSRRHARIFREGENWMIEDLGSRNGTLRNGHSVEHPERLASGDEIQLSGSVLRVLAPHADRPSASTSEIGDHTIFRPASDLIETASGSVDTNAMPAASKRYTERLRMLNDVHQTLSRSIELEELLDLILNRAFEHLAPEEGAIFLKGDDEEGYRRAATRTLASRPGDPLYSETLVHEVADKGLAALVLDVESDERFGGAESILAAGIRSLVAAPLLDSEGSLGMIVLSSRANRRQFAEDDMELLVSLASVAALRIRNLALAVEAAERRRMEQELQLARQIQVGLLPDSMPDLPGYDLHGGNIPSRGVSGDYYEAIERDGECVLLVGDVSGKGVAASLLTASLEALTAGPIETGKPPEAICEIVSQRLFLRTPPAKYATLFLCALEVATGRLTYANAGHNPALVVRADGTVDQLSTTGMPIGLMPGATYTAGETRLDPGDTLVIYTDGITEATDPDDNEFGTDGLAELCRQHRTDDLPDLARAIEKGLDAFAKGTPYADDRTVVMARRLS